MKLIRFLLILILWEPFSGTSADKRDELDNLVNNKRIGIISFFPSPLGIFHNNRAILIDNSKWVFSSYISLFPEKNTQLNREVNQEITSLVNKNLSLSFPTCQFIQLASSSPERGLSGGYLIEGIWGVEANSINVLGIEEKLNKNNLDIIIAVVPVTYHLPAIKADAGGLNLSFVGNKIYFSATYAIFIFSRQQGVKSYKTYRSIKQVFEKGTINPHGIMKLKYYDEEHLDYFFRLFTEDFIPHLSNQIIMFLKDPECEFPHPKKPFDYLLPH